MVDFKQQLNAWNQKLNNFGLFIVGKLKHFPNISLGEQISYSSIGLGLVLVLVSIVLFIW